jgi:hypothetical protein
VTLTYQEARLEVDHPIVGAVSPDGSPPSPLPPTPPPALLPATPPARRSRRRWWIFGGGGCGAIALILVLVVVVVFINDFNNSPLRHFPTEAGASTVSDNFLVSTGGQNSETLVIDDPNSLTAVETYYQSALDTNGWTVQATDPSLAVSGDGWQFSRTGSSAQFGITFVTMGAITEITVQYLTGRTGSSPTPFVNPSLTELMLTATEVTAALPPLPTPVTKYTDAEINGQLGTDHRAFLANDGTDYVDMELYGYVGPQAAAHDYPNLVSSGCAPGRGKSTHPKIGAATQADEFECSNGIFWITFQQGVLTCAVSTASASAVEDLARAESAKITQIPSPWTAPTSGASPSASP